jgi:hypothetical protein
MVGILGVDVQDGPEILINAGSRHRMRPNLHPLDPLLVHGVKAGGIKALDGRSGEQQSGQG